jgi:uncharacterized protein DUF4136
MTDSCRRRLLPGGRLRLAVLLGLGLALASSAGAADVKVDYDSHADFAHYKTWSWRTGTAAPNPVSDKRIREDIETRLAARGVTRVDEGGQLEVVYHAAGDSQISVDKLGYKEPSFQTEATRVRYVRSGSILLDMIDAASGKVVWRGQAQEVADPTYTDVIRKIDQTMDKLFERFPPGKR